MCTSTYLTLLTLKFELTEVQDAAKSQSLDFSRALLNIRKMQQRDFQLLLFLLLTMVFQISDTLYLKTTGLIGHTIALYYLNRRQHLSEERTSGHAIGQSIQNFV